MGLLLFGHTGLSAFAAERAQELHLQSAAVAFAIYGFGNIVVRFVGARYVDRLNMVVGPLLAAGFVLAGMLAIGLVDSVAALYVGAGLPSVGQMLQGTTLAPMVIRRAPAGDRAAAIGTYSAFADLSTSLGGLVLGLAAAWYGSSAGAFLTGGVAAALAVLLVPWAAEVPVRRVLARRAPAHDAREVLS